MRDGTKNRGRRTDPTCGVPPGSNRVGCAFASCSFLEGGECMHGMVRGARRTARALCSLHGGRTGEGFDLIEGLHAQAGCRWSRHSGFPVSALVIGNCYFARRTVQVSRGRGWAKTSQPRSGARKSSQVSPSALRPHLLSRRSCPSFLHVQTSSSSALLDAPAVNP